MLLDGRRVELGGEYVSDRITLESAADTTRIPMNVLQHAAAVVGRSDAKVGAQALLPRLGEIPDGKLALEQRDLEIEAQHDVEVVGDLIGIGADE